MQFIEPTSKTYARAGDTVLITGYPHNTFFEDTFLLTSGILAGTASLERALLRHTITSFDVFSTAGASGSPVFTLDGEMIGMLTHSEFFTDDVGGFSYALDLTE